MVVTGALLFTGQNQAAAQGITVRGRVVERGTSEPIAGATVELSGGGRKITNPAGDFFFTLTRARRSDLTVKMVGYRDHGSTLVLNADTTVVIELDVEAVRLPGVTVRNTQYRLRGEVLEAGTREPVIDADVRVATRDVVRTNVAGRFSVPRLSTANPAAVQVTAFGFLPRAIEIRAERDTTITITIALEPDPIGNRMIDMQMQRLETRANAVGHSVIVLTREEILRRSIPTPWDLINQYLRPTLRRSSPSSITLPASASSPCIFIDERNTPFAEAEIAHHLPAELERIEIIDRGSMIRVYTRRYVQDMVRKRADPKAIVYVKGTGPTVCH